MLKKKEKQHIVANEIFNLTFIYTLYGQTTF